MHRVEIDQSGQISKLNTDTVFAFSNGISRVIVIPARVKRAVYQRLKERYREVREPYLALFVAGVFLLIKDHLKEIEKMLIDEEFTGKEAQIRGRLLNYIRAIEPRFTKDRIVFWRIGKKSRAHLKAWEVYRARTTKQGKARPDKIITLTELLSILGLR
ncbi:MAG: hypothetical protein QXP01_00770 [Candidatus Hadarchaeum sp.]